MFIAGKPQCELIVWHSNANREPLLMNRSDMMEYNWPENAILLRNILEYFADQFTIGLPKISPITCQHIVSTLSPPVACLNMLGVLKELFTISE